MGLKKLCKKINGRLNRATVKTMNFYNNLMSGIIGGIIVAFLFLINFKLHWLSLAYPIFMYLVGLRVMYKNSKKIKSEKSRKQQIKNYHWNLLAAILGSIYITIVFKFQNRWIIQIISGAILFVVFITISYFRIKKR
jgi:hypothetical protein